MSNTRLRFGSIAMATAETENQRGQQEEKSIVVPTWVISALKFLTPAVLVLVAMYYKIDGLEKDVLLMRGEVSERCKELAVLKIELATTKTDLAINTLKLTNADESVARILVLIQKDIETIKNDLKAIQNRQMGRASLDQP